MSLGYSCFRTRDDFSVFLSGVPLVDAMPVGPKAGYLLERHAARRKEGADDVSLFQLASRPLHRSVTLQIVPKGTKSIWNWSRSEEAAILK